MGIFDRIFGNKSNKRKQDSILMKNSIQKFWDWFAQNQDHFFKTILSKENIEFDFLNPVTEKLRVINNHVFLLIGVNEAGEAELVFTAEGVVTHFAIVEEIVEEAPSFANWKFLAHKPASDMSRFDVKIGDYVFNLSNIKFVVNEHYQYPDLIDISLFYADFYDESDAELILNGCLIFLDNYLGEIAFASMIDEVSLIDHSDDRERIDVSKLKGYLDWRRLEFIEKYEAVRVDTYDDEYSLIKAQLESGLPLKALVNKNLIHWDAKPSHPWILRVDIFFRPHDDLGLASEIDTESMDLLEEGLMSELIDQQGYLNVGRQTADGLREVFFACKEFIFPAKILTAIKKQYANSSLDIDFTIYRDKYWKSLDFFKLDESI